MFGLTETARELIRVARGSPIIKVGAIKNHRVRQALKQQGVAVIHLIAAAPGSITLINLAKMKIVLLRIAAGMKDGIAYSYITDSVDDYVTGIQLVRRGSLVSVSKIVRTIG